MYILELIHLLSALVWIGGMFFAYVILRPAIIETLDPGLRLMLWQAAFSRFFPWVWGSIIALLVTGLWMSSQLASSFEHINFPIKAMLIIGLVMIALFVYLYFKPFRHLKDDLAQNKAQAAAKQLAIIRKVVALNLTLGLVIIAIIKLG